MAGDVPSKVVSGKYVRQIVVTAPGPQGSGGLTAAEIPDLVAFTHSQLSSSNTWTIVHNLDFYPNVTVFDSAGSMVEGSVTHSSKTTLTIAFSAAISGKAYLS